MTPGGSTGDDLGTISSLLDLSGLETTAGARRRPFEAATRLPVMDFGSLPHQRMARTGDMLVELKATPPRAYCSLRKTLKANWRLELESLPC